MSGRSSPENDAVPLGICLMEQLAFPSLPEESLLTTMALQSLQGFRQCGAQQSNLFRPDPNLFGNQILVYG